ncbi:uncharacterized protein LOC103315518 isoform X2 [Nasonia vitripennis]|uniref:CUB domain-containing protein n=1 Tax=Nasonia vitripennis TaxID=7425 RepID=A0A7M7PWK1_NASVI|nr:uncharacterized protein LOC103315518 isoform X2 [Nasonia vitripennis]
MNWSSRCSPLRVLIFILLKCGRTRAMLAAEEAAAPRLLVAASHTALSGDLGVLIIELQPSAARATSPGPAEAADTVELADGGDYGQIPLQEPLALRVLRLDGFAAEAVGEVPVQVPNVAGVNVSLVVPCGLFSRGGSYSLELRRRGALLRRAGLEVRWPQPALALEPQRLESFPSQPVLASLEYAGVSCEPAAGLPVPRFSLQLVYCGASVLSCDPRNRSQAQRAAELYSEEVRGFPAQRLLTLRCEFFGLAGHYALRLRPGPAEPSAPTSSAYIKVEWSDLFVFNVRARSVYPCSAGGVSVLFEYPACRLPGDRVRLYGRLRADVASLAPPSSLHYVAELKAPPGQHGLAFDCELFTERFVEYCFVYVSQAYSGAMSEVRVDCIPTFPLQEADAGGWGAWSQWTPCSSSCAGGTRTRHRFCDAPAPRYGAKFCQGPTVESEACGGAAQLDLRGAWSPGDWECRHGAGLAAERPEVAAELGPDCRCGCSLRLADEEERILAASGRLCPGRSFWLVRAGPGRRLRLRFDQARFPCARDELAYARLRDGDSLIDELLADLSAERREPRAGLLTSSGPRLLLEFFSDEQRGCPAGFLAHVSVLRAPEPAQEPSQLNETSAASRPKVLAAAGRWALWLTPAHLVAASLLCLMFLASVFLALQYACKYRKYQLAEDLDSLTDNSACSGSTQAIARRARALSSSTLISEVVSLVRLPGRRGSPRHARLEETSVGEPEEGYESTGSPSASSASSASGASARTLAAEPAGPQPEVRYARPVKLRTFGPISPVSEEAASRSEDGRRLSATSASTSLNNGSSPVSSSSNSTLRRYGGSGSGTGSGSGSGKASKERRNRERLLQGPGSELSLANPELDLELDYYDYNVLNAGAAPGSYLGMDPAFLVWIPPLSGDELDGAALSPAEYRRRLRRLRRRPRLARHQEDSSDAELEPQTGSRGLGPPADCPLHDQIIMEYKARLNEGMLPIHRILEESLPSAAADVIPNRLGGRRLPKRTRQDSSESDGLPVNDLDTPRTRRRLLGRELGRELDRDSATILELNAAQPPQAQTGVNIPLAEFSRNRLDSPVKVHTRCTGSKALALDAAETKPSLYDLIADGDEGIKFADDDEYVDNKVVA